MPQSSELQELVFDRLTSSGATGTGDAKWSDYVLAALQGDHELSAALDGIAPKKPQTESGVGIRSIAVTALQSTEATAISGFEIDFGFTSRLPFRSKRPITTTKGSIAICNRALPPGARAHAMAIQSEATQR